MRVAIVYDDPGPIRLSSHDSHTLQQMEETVAAAHSALFGRGFEVHLVPLPPHPEPASILRLAPDVVLTFSTGAVAKRRQLHVVAFLESLGVKFVGSDLRGQVLALDKGAAKALLRQAGLNTPNFLIVRPDERPERVSEPASYPVMVKPALEGSSFGIKRDSVVFDRPSLEGVLAQRLARYREPILVETLLDGREFTVGILGNSPPTAFPVQEILYNEGWPEGEPRIYSYRAKTEDWTGRQCPAQLPGDLANAIQELAVSAFRALGLRDLARVDIRLDRDGRPAVLEANALPGLQPGYSEYPRMAAVAGLQYTDLLERLAREAHSRGL